MVQKVSNSMLVSPGGGGGGSDTVTSVNAGTNVTVSGTATDPVVNVPNIGVESITAGTNVTIGGTAKNPVINATAGGGGVSTVVAGTNVTIGGTPSAPVVNAAGAVAEVVAGTNVTVTGTTANPTINVPTLVKTITAGTNITIGGTATDPVINASGGGGAGVLVQRKSNTNAATSKTTLVAPQDDTAPQRSETGLAVSVSITPSNASNYLDITGSICFSSKLDYDSVVVCVFDSGDPSALATFPVSVFRSSGYLTTVPVMARVPATSTAARTYEVRIGCGGTATQEISINSWGATPTRSYGGTMASRIQVDEVTP